MVRKRKKQTKKPVGDCVKVPFSGASANGGGEEISGLVGGYQAPKNGNLRLLAFLVLVAVVFLTYANAFHSDGFVMDSKAIIGRDTRVHEVSWENLSLIFSKGYWWASGGGSQLYRPLTTLSYLFNYAILGNGETTTGYHVVNFLLHLLNVLLVFFLTLRLLHNRVFMAFFIAAIFGVHPINVEVVTNIVGRADLLATLSILAGFLCYVRSAEGVGTKRWLWLAAVLVITAFGMFCKETAILVLGVVILYDGVFRVQRKHANVFLNMFFHLCDFFRTGYVAFIPPLAGFFYARGVVFSRLGVSQSPFVPFLDNPLAGADFWAARLTAIKVIGKYCLLLIWPANLSIDYSYNQIPLVNWPFNSWEDWQAVVVLALLVFVGWAALSCYRRSRELFFYLLLFLGALLPTSNMLPRPGEPLFAPSSWLIGTIMAERFMYLPSLGFAGVLVVSAVSLCGSGGRSKKRDGEVLPPVRQKMAFFILSLLIVCFGLRTFWRNFDWLSEYALWSKAVQTAPQSFKTHYSLASVLYNSSPDPATLDQAIAEAERALEITDAFEPLLVNLGLYYREKGDMLAFGSASEVRDASNSADWYERSVAVLERGVRLDQELNAAYRQRAVLAGMDVRQVAAIGNTETYYNLGLSLTRLRRYQKALDAYSSLQHLAPFDHRSYRERAAIFQTLRDQEQTAISLHQLMLLQDTKPETGRELLDLYRQTAPDCLVQDRAGREALDYGCPTAHRRVCAANLGLVEVFLGAKQFDVAWQIVQGSAREYQCPQKLYEHLLPR